MVDLRLPKNSKISANGKEWDPLDNSEVTRNLRVYR